MQRLVYSPKAFAYIGTTDAKDPVVNVSDYITRGTVTRKINQVSTAELTLRNPQRMFTKLGSPKFRPMDRITIFLQRIPGYPIQVFTGYLDQTPYYQLYPGTVTLRASCTLKKIMHTYWDPALPFTIEFLQQYGWIANGSGQLTSPGQTAAGSQTSPDFQQQIAADNAQLLTDLKNAGLGDQQAQAVIDATAPDFKNTDAGIGELLFEVLKKIGGWDPSNIYIEPLPNDITDKMKALYATIIANNTIQEKKLNDFFQKIIGTVSLGTGSPNAAGATTVAAGAGGGKQIKVRVGQEGGGDIGRTGSCSVITGSGWSELAQNGAQNINWGAATAAEFKGMGGLPCGTELIITNPNNGKTTRAKKQDNGRGSPGGTGYDRPMNVYPTTASELGIGGDNETIMIVSRADGKDINSPLSKGTVTPSSSTTPNSTSTGASGNPSSGGTSSSTTGGGGPNGNGSLPGSTTSSASRQGAGSAGTVSTVTQSWIFPKSYNTPAQSTWTSDQGIDIPAAAGTPILAVGPGKIIATDIGGFTNGSANSNTACPVLQVTAGPLNGQYFYYGHCTINGKCKVGDTVTAGQQIGEIGAGQIGQSTGPHIEFGISNASGTAPAYSKADGGSKVLPIMKDLQANHSIDPATAAGAATPGGTPTGTGAAAGQSLTEADLISISTAAAFSAIFDFPTVQQTQEALMLVGERSYLNDQSLLPFIQQLAQGSLRSFQSMPNGNFFAFFPDYFGGFGHRKPYWEIDDIEVLDGRIDLNDDALATHVYVVGDSYLGAASAMLNEAVTAGVVTVNNIGNGFLKHDTTPTTSPKQSKQAPTTSKSGKSHSKGKIGSTATPTTAPSDPFLGTANDVINFLNRYGVRPVVENMPFIRSHYFELFMAFQQFQLLWARQFQTTFTFTFMPEIFPGGLVSFPSHGLQMYVEEVQHSFDLESGFTTTANLTAPAALPNTTSQVPSGMIIGQALADNLPRPATPVKVPVSGAKAG